MYNIYTRRMLSMHAARLGAASRPVFPLREKLALTRSSGHKIVGHEVFYGENEGEDFHG